MAETFDAVIVGGGAIGLGIGWRARELGLSVIVLDCGRTGAAWNAAAGMLAPVTEATFGEESLLALNLQSARRYPAFLEHLSAASGSTLASTAAGTMHVALDRDQAEALHRLYEFQISMGLQVEWLTSHRVRALEPALGTSARSGILAATDREIDPRQLVNALEIAFRRDGGTVRRDAEVSAVEVRDDRIEGVRLTGGERISAERVVIAAGCWSSRINGIPSIVAKAVRPVKGQILTLAPRRGEPPITRHVIRTEEVYLVPRPDGQVVVGATVEEQGFDLTLTAGGVFELLRAAEETMPGIRDFELVATNSGLRPGTPDNAPLLGPTGIDGLIIATGHYRNGILLTPVTADAIGTFLAKGEVPVEIEAFHPERFAR